MSDTWTLVSHLKLAMGWLIDWYLLAEWEGLSSGSGDYTKRKKRQAEGSEIGE